MIVFPIHPARLLAADSQSSGDAASRPSRLVITMIAYGVF
jgi:hypothetical protein